MKINIDIPFRDNAFDKDGNLTEIGLSDIAEHYKYDFMGWLLTAFDWENDPELQRVKLLDDGLNKQGFNWGPDKWTFPIIQDMNSHMRNVDFYGKKTKKQVPSFWASVRSGHAIGKTTMTAWLILFFLSTRTNTIGFVTATSIKQVDTNIFKEVRIWLEKCLYKHWFKVTNSLQDLYIQDIRKGARSKIRGVNPSDPQSVTGLHNASGSILLIVDEASSSSRELFQALYNSTKTGESFLFAFGNPMKNSGEFYDQHTKSERMRTYKVSSLEAQTNNQAENQKIIEEFGMDSDYVRMRLLGEFPSSGEAQLISTTAIESMTCKERIRNARQTRTYTQHPCIFGVDVAGSGADMSVIAMRQGSRVEILFESPTANFEEIVEKIIEFGKLHKVDRVFFDIGGVGFGMKDMLRIKGFENAQGIDFGQGADNPSSHLNKRSEIFYRMKMWAMYDDKPYIENTKHETIQKILSELKAIQIAHRDDQKTQIIPKKLIKKDIGRSPDYADAIALTFSKKVYKTQNNGYNKNRVIDKLINF